MEKLEEILHAEEDARHVLGEARDRATEIGRQAADDIQRLETEAKSAALRELATLRAGILRAADEEANHAASRSEHALGEMARSAEVRIDDGIGAVVAEILG